MKTNQLINQTSNATEYYTPRFIVEAVRIALGGKIDLDPCSTAKANEVVQARRYFSLEEENPDWYLQRSWKSDALWLNHPFGMKITKSHRDWQTKFTMRRYPHDLDYVPGTPEWIGKFLQSVESGELTQACVISFAATSEGWFQPLAEFPQCYLSPRTNYVDSEGKVVTGVSKGSVVTYIGKEIDRFHSAFFAHGVTKIKYAP